MFVHSERLEFLPKPGDYTSQERLDVELKRLFLPVWHLVGVKSEISRPGDFFTRELLGTPLHVRNFDGEIRTFLNVCAHRHCLLTHEARGHSPTLRCQYHGWEYKSTGETAKIPDAGCFRPFDRESARLHGFPTEVRNDLIFVALTDDPPDLDEYLGPAYRRWHDQFASNRWKLIWRWEADFASNWKIPVENTLESYHLPYLHQATFGGTYPSEKSQTHELTEQYTTLAYDINEEARLARLQERMCKRLGGECTNVYSHCHVHPHLVFTATDLYLHTQIYLPVSPTTSKTSIWYYALRGRNRGPITALVRKAVQWHGRRANRLIQLEDAGVFPDVQRGIEHTRHRGCIGTREERLFEFHNYVRKACDGASEDVAAPAEHAH
jgi:phenylpropionate dioxygenase-like ring-hydroxylating dioxygenase large terminal subunit